MSTPSTVLGGWVVAYRINDELLRVASPRDREETIELIDRIEAKGGEIQVCMATVAFLNLIGTSGRPLVNRPERDRRCFGKRPPTATCSSTGTAN